MVVCWVAWVESDESDGAEGCQGNLQSASDQRMNVVANLEQGHQTYVLRRPEIGVVTEKIQMLLSFKKQGAIVVTGSFNDHRSLVEALKQVDVVICAVSGVYIRSHQILLQLKLIEAIKEAGNIKRFFPSEFDTDPAKMADALEPGGELAGENVQRRCR